MPVCVCGETIDEGDPTHEFCRFDSSAPAAKTDPAPGPHEAETWPPSEAAPIESHEHHVLQGYNFKWADPPADLLEFTRHLAR